MKFLSDRMTSASGSIGGTVFSHNKSGLYTRAKRISTNKDSSIQNYKRNLFAKQNQNWKNISENNRLAWNQFASTQVVKNKLGQDIQISGKSWFIKLNINADSTVGNYLTSPPPLISPPPTTDFTIIADTTNDIFRILVTDSGSNDFALVIKASTGISTGKSYKKNIMRMIDKQVNYGIGLIQLETVYKYYFGLLPAVGSKIFIECFNIMGVSKFRSASIINSAIVI